MSSQPTGASVVGVEYEYKWRVDAVAEDWKAEHPESGDHLIQAVLNAAAPKLGGEHGAPHTFAQSALYFDTPSWQLNKSGLSLAALVNYGAMTGTGWLVLKETVRYAGRRRDALEIGDSMSTGEFASAVARGDAAPLQRLRRRFDSAPEGLAPYGRAVQRRRKVLWRLGDGIMLGLTLDSTKLTPSAASLEMGTQHWWFEIEANSSDSRALAALDDLAAEAAVVFHAEPVDETKPQVAARLSGWDGEAV
ncbi:hypothetical protein [Streptomyces sp. NPDC102282]|uniref:hypothetical protein n=1 Tax=Streptomyces sp. NPDC102282 TaxID=3366154 RepID=UPI0037FBD131